MFLKNNFFFEKKISQLFLRIKLCLGILNMKNNFVDVGSVLIKELITYK